MAKITRQDFILNKNGDFPLQDTVLQGVWLETPYGDSDTQHVNDIIIDNLGSTKSNPTLGYGVKKYLNSEVSIYEPLKDLKYHLGQDDYEAKDDVLIPVGKGFVIDTSYINRK